MPSNELNLLQCQTYPDICWALLCCRYHISHHREFYSSIMRRPLTHRSVVSKHTRYPYISYTCIIVTHLSLGCSDAVHVRWSCVYTGTYLNEGVTVMTRSNVMLNNVNLTKYYITGKWRHKERHDPTNTPYNKV